MSAESSVFGSGSDGNHNVYLMITMTRKLTQERFLSLMEILKSSHGGKPTSTFISWV